jgi:starch synthase (maltosyl-transferring)
MTPATGERVLRFVGDRIAFNLREAGPASMLPGWRAYLRTNLGRAERLRHEIIYAHSGKLGLAASSWGDIPMDWTGHDWTLRLALAEVGFFRAKAYAVDPQNRQHWPDGPDVGLSVHPDSHRTNNSIYCAFTRMFGPTRTRRDARDPVRERLIAPLDKEGYAVIPPSGKFRDLIRQLPHIIDTLGCRILQLLPVNPTPTTYARFGRFGSPYACQDLLAIDPALVEFDKRTTGIDQFRELTHAAHLKGGRVFLDVVINHTGWGSTLQENRPEWYVRDQDGTFLSPGAWGTTWEDLTELEHRNPALWEHLGDVFLEWCRRGVDGFRCDAGYKIPAPAWQFITARVLEEFPETIFLLEGLGGSWEVTENLLTEGGMQWAYSELFQNYTGEAVSAYLDYSLRQCRRTGLYVHFSETHDNDRLAKKGRAWSLLRNRLCALTSASGGYAFTCGVEWLAIEKINVHQCGGLAWDNPDNLIPELAHLNRLLSQHPCFFDNADLTRLSDPESPVYALSRVSADGLDRLLVLINTDLDQPHPVAIAPTAFRDLGEPTLDLLSGKRLPFQEGPDDLITFPIEAGSCHCLSDSAQPRGLSGDAYRLARAQSAWAMTALSHRLACEDIGPCDWKELAETAAAQPSRFLAALDGLAARLARTDLLEAIRLADQARPFPKVITWRLPDARRVTPVPPGHWLLLENHVPFRATLEGAGQRHHVQSIAAVQRHYACFRPGLLPAGNVRLRLDRLVSDQPAVEATLRILGAQPCLDSLEMAPEAVAEGREIPHKSGLVLLTNGRGGMARLQIDLGNVQSKYDCVLAANLHPSVPVDRHIFVKRIRVWVVAEGFITPLNGENLIGFTPGPPAEWRFVANAGDGRAVEIHLLADMLPDKNVTVLSFRRPSHPPSFGTDLPDPCQVSVTVRPDVLDRNFHFESRRDEGTERHLVSNSRALSAGNGFEFVPAPDRQLRAWTDAGRFHPEPEWSLGLDHPVERSRGQADSEDAYSPGWFELPLPKRKTANLALSAEAEWIPASALATFAEVRRSASQRETNRAGLAPEDAFGKRLALAAQAFLVRRDDTKTVIAGYPWFLDWGRDALICARGLLAAGLEEEVRQLLIAFGRFEQDGTLPNSIHGEDASNRDTSDAPLWYGVVAEELAEKLGPHFYETKVDVRGRTVENVLRQIAEGYRNGTPNGIRLDPASGLIWSPSHFTWMDTNYPAGTPREGYPVEIQALWIRLCRQLARLNAASNGESWNCLAERALASLQQFFWIEERGYLADLLIAGAGRAASEALQDNALRSNYLLAISLGLIEGNPAQRAVQAAIDHLVLPGALRSLAPLPVKPPLPVLRPDGQPLNNPGEPYWGRYEGDEDTHRKPAYHNGTAWTWSLPNFCEALARAWNFEPEAAAAARAYLGSMDQLLSEGCLGQVPEILDGDAPHRQRGCDAQAWSVTEALRVWKLLA